MNNSVSVAAFLRITSPFLEENSLLCSTSKPRVDLLTIILNTSDNIGRNQIFWEVSIITLTSQNIWIKHFPNYCGKNILKCNLSNLFYFTIPPFFRARSSLNRVNLLPITSIKLLFKINQRSGTWHNHSYFPNYLITPDIITCIKYYRKQINTRFTCATQ
jgi:hypothetical protein